MVLKTVVRFRLCCAGGQFFLEFLPSQVSQVNTSIKLQWMLVYPLGWLVMGGLESRGRCKGKVSNNPKSASTGAADRLGWWGEGLESGEVE